MENIKKKFLQILINILVISALLIFIFQEKVQARTIDYFAKPQIGAWFGVITPVYTTYNDVATNLGYGLFFRSITPLNNLKIGIESSYQYFGPKGSDGVNKLTLVPVFSNILYRLPSILNFPMTFQLKLGAGGSWVKIEPDRVDQWDPIGMAGIEGTLAGGRIFNFGLRIDYLLIYEQHIKGAKRNGHIINAGITIFFNI